MIASISAVIGDPFFAGLAALALGVVVYLTGLSVRDFSQRTRRQRQRQEAHRHFWGYD